MKNGYEIAEVPTEGKWFEVKPQSINQKLFKTKRPAGRQEHTRKLILEAFEEMSKHPEKYARNFRTMIAEKEWSLETVADLKEHACKLGDHNADWVEQALEWAQRIANGESWKAICDEKDTANWYRLVVWKNGYARLVGGSVNSGLDFPASVVDFDFCNGSYGIIYTVPLVVSYEE